ncbi:MAG: phosphotransferase enzyme family protein [Paenisporosarcina sp.]
MELRTQLEMLLRNPVSDLNELDRGLQNRLFSFHRNKEKLVARLTLPKRRSKEQIESELSFMETLQGNGIRTVQPYELNGKSIFTVRLKEQSYILTLFEFSEGNVVDVMNPSEWNEDFFRKWGETIAEMHKGSMNSEATLLRPIFIEDRESVNLIPSLLKSVDPLYDMVYEGLKKELATYLRTPENFGLIHNDLHQGNFFVDAGNLRIFDFDDCAYNWFAQDLAVSIYHALWTGESFHPGWIDFHAVFLKNFFDGYRSLHTISKDDWQLVLILLRLRELFLFLLFKNKWNLDDLEEWQSYKLAQLESAIQNGSFPYQEEISQYRMQVEGK